MTQADLARAADLSLATIRAIERGARSPSDDSLDCISAALGVDPSRLMSDSGRASTRVRAALPDISAAIAAYDLPDGLPTRAVPQLRRDVAEAEAWRLGAQYVRAAGTAAALLTDALRTLHAAEEVGRAEAARLLASAARTADAVAYKSGAHDLSARLIDVMRWASAEAGDPLSSATAAYVRTEVFFAARAHFRGLRALEAAIDASPGPRDEAAIAARGALHMRAAVIAGRAGDEAAAGLHVAEARRFGDQVREGVYRGTGFGPDSVRIHEVSLAVSLGGDHVSRALDVACEWKPPADMPSERRSGFYIELARAQLWCGHPDDAFESLKVARQCAPQHTREHPWVREDVAALRRLKRGAAEELSRFAEWVGAV